MERTRLHVGQQVEQWDFGPGTVSVVETDRTTVLSEGHGYTALALALLEGEDPPLRLAA